MRAASKEELEHKLFKWLLIGALPFWMHRIGRDLMFNHPWNILGSDLLFFVSTAVILYCLRYKSMLTPLRLIYCLGWIAGFAYYWHLLGGITGPMTYVFFTVIALFVGFVPNRFKEAFAIIMCGSAVLLAWDSDYSYIMDVIPLVPSIQSLLPIDYVVNSMVIAAALVFMKNTFDGERQYIEHQNVELINLNEQLNEQNKELAKKSAEIESIKNDLETIIRQRTNQLEDRHKLLAQYAYDNAHVVRRPLTNIQGLLEVLEMEEGGHSIPAEQINSLRKKLGHLDDLTRQINVILN